MFTASRQAANFLSAFQKTNAFKTPKEFEMHLLPKPHLP